MILPQHFFAACLLAWGVLGCAHAPSGVPTQPEAASGFIQKQAWTGQRFAVAGAHPLAVQAGRAMIEAGGSAMDAAVAVQMVLGLVEPQSSGLGGGGFLLYFNGQEVQAFDGRETAPTAIDDKLLLDPQGQPMAFYDAAVGGRAVGVPGLLAMLELAHRRHGKLPWAQTLAPAIALAEEGFAISPRLHSLLLQDPHLKKDPQAAAYFYQADGRPYPIGHKLRNPALAQVLRSIAARGATAFYQGELAQAMVNKVHNHPTNPGALSLMDLATYQPKVRVPLCHEHQGLSRYSVCGLPPPSSGGLAVGQILGLLSRQEATPMLDAQGVPGAQWLHLYMEASRLAFADRAQYVGDPDFVNPPAGQWQALLAADYLNERAKLIGPFSMKQAPAGHPGPIKTAYAVQAEQPEYGTSHISIIDPQGHGLAMTSSIEDQFGSRQMVHGFLLNNQLTDFSFLPTDTQGKLVANRVQPGKRPRSSMAPTLVFDANNQHLLMSVGSPGGAAIIHYTAKVLYGVLSSGLGLQQAIDLPNFGSMGEASLLETQRFGAHTIKALSERGNPVREQPMTSGVHAVQINPQGLSGGADPRREGVVMGQ